MYARVWVCSAHISCVCVGIFKHVHVHGRERERQCVYITLFPEGDRISLNVTIVFQCINSINAC